MLVRQVTTNAQTGEVTEAWVEMPDVITPEAQAIIDAQNAATAQSVATNTSSLDTQANQALANLRAYRDLASPTQAQTVAVVRLLCRVAIGFIRFRLNKLDGAD